MPPIDIRSEAVSFARGMQWSPDAAAAYTRIASMLEPLAVDKGAEVMSLKEQLTIGIHNMVAYGFEGGFAAGLSSAQLSHHQRARRKRPTRRRRK